MIDDHSSSELHQADRLEQYLTNLERKEVIPPDATVDDIELFAMARQFNVLRATPQRLHPPIERKRRWQKFVTWMIPLPIAASIGIALFFWKTQPMVDVSAELAALDHDEQLLLQAEMDLDTALTEIDVLTATDYLDQL